MNEIILSDGTNGMFPLKILVIFKYRFTGLSLNIYKFGTYRILVCVLLFLVLLIFHWFLLLLPVTVQKLSTFYFMKLFEGTTVRKEVLNYD